MYYDLLRIEKNRSDCCGLLMCKPRSIICCGGKFALDEEDKIKKSDFQKLLSEKYIPFVTKSPMNWITISLFTCLLIFSIVCTF